MPVSLLRREKFTKPCFADCVDTEYIQNSTAVCPGLIVQQSWSSCVTAICKMLGFLLCSPADSDFGTPWWRSGRWWPLLSLLLILASPLEAKVRIKLDKILYWHIEDLINFDCLAKKITITYVALFCVLDLPEAWRSWHLVNLRQIGATIRWNVVLNWSIRNHTTLSFEEHTGPC